MAYLEWYDFGLEKSQKLEKKSKNSIRLNVINVLNKFHLNMFQAKENFKKQLEYFKPHIDEGLDFRMGLTFWTDRWFAANEMDASNTFLQYKCGLPLTNISVVCRDNVKIFMVSVIRRKVFLIL